jgi:hypothetical protein
MNMISPNDNQRGESNPFAAHANSQVLSRVVKRPLVGVGKDGSELPVSGHVGTYTIHDGSPVFLGVVSDNYEVVQFKDIVQKAEQVMTNFFTPEQLDGVKIKDVMGRQGAFVERRYTVAAFSDALEYGNTTAKTLEVGTTVAAELRIATGYDGERRTTLSTGTRDLVCNNGMTALSSMDLFSRRHTKNSGNIDVFTPWLEECGPSFHNKVEQMREWANTPVRASQVEDVIRALPKMSNQKAEKILERVWKEMRERGNNAYAVTSALTFYSSHNSNEFPVRNTGNDNVATTLADRELQVQAWVGSEPFQQLLAA